MPYQELCSSDGHFQVAFRADKRVNLEYPRQAGGPGVLLFASFRNGFIIDPGNDGTKVGIGNKDPQAKLDVTGSAQFGSDGTKSTFTAEGYWQPRWMTSGEIQLATPGAIGVVVGNSDIKDLCISTGAAQGNWAQAGTKGASGCY